MFTQQTVEIIYSCRAGFCRADDDEYRIKRLIVRSARKS